ncbi:MAG: alcohol dehydrogenase [Verrucomicrobiaceae bacterium]|nr:alcohol dehydrogenase [Verrucomicrobiaceae bacterium]
MKALVLNAIEGLDSVELKDVAVPALKAGEVLVALKAASLNHRELWITLGQYPDMVPAPFTLGCDGVGVIESVGEGVPAVRIGEEVIIYPAQNWGEDPRFPAPEFGCLGMPGPGTIAEKIAVSAAHALPKPNFLSFEEAAALPLAALTAWRGLFTKAGLKAGEKLLITGIGGGVAMFALQFAVKLGAQVFVTSGSDETLAKAIALGAKAGFNYKDESWRKALPKVSGGIDVVFDGAPGASYANYGRALNMGARVVVYGSTGGFTFPVHAPELFLKNINIAGTNVGNLDDFTAMLAFVNEKQLKPVIDRKFTLAESIEAMHYLKDAHGFGKVVITI